MSSWCALEISVAAETRDTVVWERLLGTPGHGLENKSRCGWETAALSLSTQFIWVTLLLGLIICPGTQSLPDALPELRGSPQQTMVGKGTRGERPVNPPCECTQSRGILRASCSRAGAGGRGIAQEPGQLSGQSGTGAEIIPSAQRTEVWTERHG